MVNKYLILLLTLAILGCDSPKKEFHVAEFEEEKQFDTEEYLRNLPLEDIFIKTLKPRHNFIVSDLYKVINYNPLYIGKKLPVTPIDGYKFKPEFHSEDSVLNVNSGFVNSIRLFVDTHQTIPNVCNIIQVPKSLSNSPSFKLDNFVNQKSHPVYIENISPYSIEIGLNPALPLHLEVLSLDNKWVKATPPFSGCGTGPGMFFLKPHHVAITAHPITYGNLKTKFRFAYAYTYKIKEGKSDTYKMDYIYSNEFYGKIDSAFFTNKNTPF